MDKKKESGEKIVPDTVKGKIVLLEEIIIYGGILLLYIPIVLWANHDISKYQAEVEQLLTKVEQSLETNHK